MSQLDPTTFQLEDGDKTEIITDEEARRGIPYLVQITGENSVRYAHDRRNAERGIELSAKQTHTLSNFRGTGVYVAAVDGPTNLRVRPAGADLQSQPEKSVRISGDVSVGSTVDITDDSNRQVGIVDLAGSANIDVSSLPTPVDVSVNDPLATEQTISSVDSTLANVEESITNNTGVKTFTRNVNGIDEPLPSVSCPAGSTLALKADANNDDVILIENDFPLAPGEGISVNVTNANNINVTPSTGTQTIYGIVESA